MDLSWVDFDVGVPLIMPYCIAHSAHRHKEEEPKSKSARLRSETRWLTLYFLNIELELNHATDGSRLSVLAAASLPGNVIFARSMIMDELSALYLILDMQSPCDSHKPLLEC